MGLSRRRFTKEFKLNAVRRLELGARLTEVARAFEVSPSVLHAGGGSSSKGPAMSFRGRGGGGGKRARGPNGSARSVSRRWRSIS